LPAVLDDLADHLERSAEVRARLISTLTYPLILIAMALVAVGIILGVLVPALLPVFEDAGAAPPLAFQVFAGAREILIGNWPVLLTGLAAIALVWLVAMSRPGPRLLRDRLWLRLPLLGSLATASETARITRMLAVLLRSGVPLVGALGIGRGVVRNRAMQAALDDAAARIREGSGLAEALGAAGLFPPLAMRLVTVGEQSGQLERMLGHVAQIHEIDVQRRIDRIMGLLTPALTIAIGLGVGIMIMAVMNAILSVNEITFQ
jgi:general secretion pathway protein F